MINPTLDAEGAYSAISSLLADLEASSDQEISDFGYPGSLHPFDSDSPVLHRSGWVKVPSGTTFKPGQSMNGTFRYMIKCTPVERSSTQHRIPAESDDSGMPSGFTAMLLIGSKPVASVVIPPVTMGFLQPYAPPDGRLPLRATVIVDALEIALRVKKTITLGIAVVTSAHREHCPRLRKGDWIFQASRSAGGAPATCESSEVVKTFYEESVSVLPSWVTLQHIISNEN